MNRRGAKSFNNAKNVTQVRQPENGRLIIKAITAKGYVVDSDPIAGPLEVVDLSFVMDAKASDGSLVISYEIGTPVYSGGLVRNPIGATSTHYPPDMAPVHAELQSVAVRIAKDIDGVIVVKNQQIR